MYRERFEGDEWNCAGELSGERYGFFLLHSLDDGVRTCGASISTKFTVLGGVVRVAALRLMAARVMSWSCRPELEREARDDPWLELRGVKKRVKRLGVIGGGLLCLREAVGAGGDEEKMSGVGSWNAARGAHGEENMAGSGPISRTALVYTQRLVIRWTATRRHEARRAGPKRKTWDGRADKI
jgi:hypothetical protein